MRQGLEYAVGVYERQRTRGPVSRSVTAEGVAIWHVFDAANVATVLNDTETFSSAVPKLGSV